jgi:hypothetical protein
LRDTFPVVSGNFGYTNCARPELAEQQERRSLQRGVYNIKYRRAKPRDPPEHIIGGSEQSQHSDV